MSVVCFDSQHCNNLRTGCGGCAAWLIFAVSFAAAMLMGLDRFPFGALFSFGEFLTGCLQSRACGV